MYLLVSVHMYICALHVFESVFEYVRVREHMYVCVNMFVHLLDPL